MGYLASLMDIQKNVIVLCMSIISFHILVLGSKHFMTFSLGNGNARQLSNFPKKSFQQKSIRREVCNYYIEICAVVQYILLHLLTLDDQNYVKCIFLCIFISAMLYFKYKIR